MMGEFAALGAAAELCFLGIGRRLACEIMVNRFYRGLRFLSTVLVAVEFSLRALFWRHRSLLYTGVGVGLFIFVLCSFDE